MVIIQLLTQARDKKTKAMESPFKILNEYEYD